ncbi:acyl-CoA thioesterase [Cumulibacter manganitolerans]|uniref:acyl-CoA thioesterase n=1 Tax=Cumulibacter manganitolerans TaxID=1884992 RepID=UPI001E56CFBF|nr:thioesterase family protein [Cumulibacter manganitolerans]
MVFETEVPLRWGDMDAYGHVNNATFVTYLEQARVNAFESRPGERTGAEMLGTGIVVVEHQIRYRRQVPFSTRPLRVRLWVEDVRAAYYITAYELWNGSGDEPELAATATTKLAPINFGTGRPRRFTTAEREYLLSFEPPGGRE